VSENQSTDVRNVRTYPRWLIRLFGCGLVLTVFAALAWPFNDLLGSLLAAAGSSAVALSLLKGEEIDDA